MSAPDGRLPSTTAWALAVAAAVGVLALAAFEPLVIAGACFGLVLVAIVSGFDGSFRRVTVVAALLPLTAFGGVAIVWIGSDPIAAFLVAIAALVAVATATVCTDRLTETALERAATAALCAGIVAGVVALLTSAVSQAGGLVPAFEAAVRVTGDGLSGTLLAFVVAGVTIACALLVLPPAAFTPPSGRTSYLRVRNGLVGWVVVGLVLASATTLALVVLAGYVPPLAGLVAVLVDGPAVRGFCLFVTVVGVVTAAVGMTVRIAWFAVAGRRRESAIVPVLVGSTIGVLGPLPAVLAVDRDPLAVVAAPVGVAAVALIAGWLIGLGYVQWYRHGADSTPEPEGNAVVMAVLLGLGGLTIGTTVETVAGLEGIRTAAISIGTLATGLFVYDIGRYGQTLARDVGRIGVDPQPQYARIGWSGLVAGVGTLVAVLGLAVATLFAPSLSVPSTAAVVAAIGTVLLGTWLLFR